MSQTSILLHKSKKAIYARVWKKDIYIRLFNSQIRENSDSVLNINTARKV